MYRKNLWWILLRRYLACLQEKSHFEMTVFATIYLWAWRTNCVPCTWMHRVLSRWATCALSARIWGQMVELIWLYTATLIIHSSIANLSKAHHWLTARASFALFQRGPFFRKCAILAKYQRWNGLNRAYETTIYCSFLNDVIAYHWGPARLILHNTFCCFIVSFSVLWMIILRCMAR